MTQYVIKESFKHQYAKDLLTKWLKEHEQNNRSCDFCGWAWRPNYGVFPELKFYKTSHPYYFEQGENSGQTLFIPDITIFHKGQAFILIEIVHRSPLTKQKLGRIRNFFGDCYFEIYTIEADHILNNTSTPYFLSYKQAA